MYMFMKFAVELNFYENGSLYNIPSLWVNFLAGSEGEAKETPVKKKKMAYDVEPDTAKLIDKDTENKKLWDEALEFRVEGAQVKFLANIGAVVSLMLLVAFLFTIVYYA